ncbi:MAG: LuxR C-terminal-related transcriptional regulator [Oscillospiraceae bacterium]|nr:LuxR C-terminal-related transcriptional regulator [Oscillospiraceae bacterium]
MDGFLLRRTGLFKAITEGKKLTFISAPSGYGKTAGMRLWLEHAGVAPLFISLSKAHNDLAAFSQALPPLAEAADPPPTPPQLAGRLLDILPEGGAMVLDGFHWITNEQIIEAAALLAERLPLGCRMFIVSRTPLPSRFELFRVKGLLTCIDADALRFDAEEIVSLAEMAGKPLSPEDGARVRGLTDGWPAAVHTWLTGKMPAGRGGRELLFQFFEDAVWSPCKNAVKKNILLACVVDVLTPPLFTALTGEADGEGWLAEICRENAFFSCIQSGRCRFHSLLREFLREKLSAAGFSAREQFLKAAEWYEQNDLPYMAVRYYLLAEARDRISAPLHALFARRPQNSSVEAHYAGIRALTLSEFPDAVIHSHIFLLQTRAWGHYLGGDAARLSADIDKLKELLAHTDDEETRSTAALFCALDPRKPLSSIVRELYAGGREFRPAALAHTASHSQNLPFFHRSCRDHSDYAGGMEEKLRALRVTLGRLAGREYDLLEHCVRAGIYYEKGDLERGLSSASKAVSEVSGDIPPETAFCAYIILASVLYAMNRVSAADEVIAGLRADIEKRDSGYLLPNLQAFTVRRRLYAGDQEAASAWLQSGLGGAAGERLALYKIYRYFTTAKAYIVTGALGEAISYIQNLADLCEAYSRPLDRMDALILLSVALRKRKRVKKADEALAGAVEIAQQYGFVQSFILEGAELSAELGRLSHRLLQPDYRNWLDSAFVKGLYLTTLRSSRQADAAAPAGGARRLSERQMELIGLLAEGDSYQSISEKTNLKVSSVKTHLKAAYQKLGAVNRREAVERAAALGILDA